MILDFNPLHILPQEKDKGSCSSEILIQEAGDEKHQHYTVELVLQAGSRTEFKLCREPEGC